MPPALLALSADPPPATETVSVLVPLLNDERRVLRCVRSLLGQIRVPKLDVVFLDAGSTDMTRRLVLKAAMDEPRLRLLVGAPTPQGWCPHAHACEQLAVAARGRTMVFADPGLALAPGAVAAAVAALRGPHELDLVVAEAHRRTRPAAIPPAGPQRTTSARLLAVDAETYWHVGGHCTAAHDPHGESGLIRAVRRSGGRVAIADGRHAIEFLDGSLWPRERAGTTGPAAGSRQAVTDTENSILHSFTDTARRLLAAFTTAPSQARRTPSRGALPAGPPERSAGPVADAVVNRAAGVKARESLEAREAREDTRRPRPMAS
ncbi:MAG: glycosyltransferase [Catenulisporales bacterium]|nr:glycosyltransferase [Catenulisporales bacterium]